MYNSELLAYLFSAFHKIKFYLLSQRLQPCNFINKQDRNYLTTKLIHTSFEIFLDPLTIKRSTLQLESLA
ncbi:uncharacterized protein METZ01_LOCUS205343 [marine metagenome]|uniref:Uncharacterized protein n=1 Tax=marine metagenome TaxID=408172 RepID=A0A382EQ48_9ZZZZ